MQINDIKKLRGNTPKQNNK